MKLSMQKYNFSFKIDNFSRKKIRILLKMLSEYYILLLRFSRTQNGNDCISLLCRLFFSSSFATSSKSCTFAVEFQREPGIKAFKYMCFLNSSSYEH